MFEIAYFLGVNPAVICLQHLSADLFGKAQQFIFPITLCLGSGTLTL
jgi:hypothetical protein